MQFLNSSALAREIPAALSANATGLLFLAFRNLSPGKRRRVDTTAPEPPLRPESKEQGLGKKGMKKSDPGASLTPISLGTLFFTAPGRPPTAVPGCRGEGCSPRRTPRSAGFSKLLTPGSRSGANMRQGGRACGAGEARRVPGAGAGCGEGSLRKVNVDPGKLRQAPARAEPESEPLTGHPLSWRVLTNGPPSPRRDSGLRAGARIAVGSPSRSQWTQTHAIKVPGESPTRAGFLRFSGASPAVSMEELSPREHSAGMGRKG